MCDRDVLHTNPDRFEDRHVPCGPDIVNQGRSRGPVFAFRVLVELVEGPEFYPVRSGEFRSDEFSRFFLNSRQTNEMFNYSRSPTGEKKKQET